MARNSTATRSGDINLESINFPNPLAGAREKLIDEEALGLAVGRALGAAVTGFTAGKKLKITGTWTIEVVSE